jgi:hypothetical protein
VPLALTASVIDAPPVTAAPVIVIGILYLTPSDDYYFTK